MASGDRIPFHQAQVSWELRNNKNHHQAAVQSHSRVRANLPHRWVHWVNGKDLVGWYQP